MTKLMRIGMIAVAVAAGAGILAAYVKSRQPESPPSSPPASHGSVPPGSLDPASRPLIQREKKSNATRDVAVWDSKTPPAARPIVPARSARSTQVGSPTRSQETLQKLSQIKPNQNSLTREQAANFNRLLQELADQGSAAVPAIREFLQQGVDLSFDAVPGGNEVNYASLRIGLLDALIQAGGEEAMLTAVQTLRTTADPLEIALLSRALDEQMPGEYREQAMTAARNTLAQASSGRWDGRDVSPLFEVLQRFGDESIVADLEKAVKQWNYYATLSLAGLPEGAGIPALIRLSQNPEITAMGNGDFALRVLAQVANQYPDAGTALLGQARANQVPDKAWPNVASALAGSYIQYGNQLLGSTAAPVDWSNQRIQGRIALVDQMLAVTSNPTGVQALQTARATLVARIPGS